MIVEQFWSNYQRECEDAFRLECSEEDIKSNKDAKKLYKRLKKQRRYIKKVERLINKIINPLCI